MNEAVGVLIVDEPYGLEPTFRAVLEHAPRLHTLSVADLAGSPDRPGARVALVVVGSEAASLSRIADLKARYPGLGVLVAFETLTAEALSRLIEAGADAFVARSADPQNVCDAILALVGHAAAPQAPTPALAGEDLTPREAEILRFLSSGFSNKEVARRLSLSVRTVETHRLNLRRKTQTGRLKDLVALARRLGLAPVTETGAVRRSAGEPLRTPGPRLLEGLAHH